MNEQSAEHNRPVQAQLRRYEADIIYKSDAYIDVVMNVKDYLEQELDIESGQSLFTTLSDEGLIPTLDLFEQFPREATELLRIMPVRVVADYKKSFLGAQEYRTWFDNAVQVGLRDHANFHDLRCVSAQSEHRLGCHSSALCPLRAMQDKVRTDAETVYETGSGLENTDEKWANQFDIVTAELDILTNYRLLTPMDSRILIDTYMQNMPENA